ncbi:MAG: hypothetical protein ACRC64_05110, partial [Plesiomonas shigelloides]
HIVGNVLKTGVSIGLIFDYQNKTNFLFFLSVMDESINSFDGVLANLLWGMMIFEWILMV